MVMNNPPEVPSMINPITLTAQAALNAQLVRISKHAVQRYQERVDPAAPAGVAAGAIRQILSTGSARTQPRHWTTCRVEPGMRFVYAANRADVCLVLRDSTVVTILTVQVCAAPRARSSWAPIPRRLRTWQERLEEEADIYEPLPDDLAWVA